MVKRIQTQLSVNIHFILYTGLIQYKEKGSGERTERMVELGGGREAKKCAPDLCLDASIRSGQHHAQLRFFDSLRPEPGAATGPGKYLRYTCDPDSSVATEAT